MKKCLLVLGMVTCLLGLTACGSKTETQASLISKSQGEELASGVITDIQTIIAQGAEDQYADYPVVTAAIESYKDALEEMGAFESIEGYEVTSDEESATIVATLKGTERDATMEIIYDGQDGLTTITTNLVYSFGELMERAALNTLLGMGTVFCVLILISLIISCMSFIPRIQGFFTKSNKKTLKTEAVDNTIAQIIENEELSDDTELVAVIAAAVAASEGAATTDGFVVRSIRRADSRKWQNA